jgi:hypothetical protein
VRPARDPASLVCRPWDGMIRTATAVGSDSTKHRDQGALARTVIEGRVLLDALRKNYLPDAISSNGISDGMLLRDITSRMRFSMLSISSRLLVRRYSSQRE